MTRVGAFHCLAFALSFPALLMGCPKKEPPPLEETKPEAAAPASAPEVTELAPLIDDAGTDAAEAAPKKMTGGGGGGGANANQLKIKQCCNAMRSQAKQLGSSPEANQLIALGMQCDMMAAQVGPQGTAPEFSQLRAVLKSLKLPAACQF
jgi:hypothetical protein